MYLSPTTLLIAIEGFYNFSYTLRNERELQTLTASRALEFQQAYSTQSAKKQMFSLLQSVSVTQGAEPGVHWSRRGV